MSDFNRRLVEEFRANNGKVGGPFADRPLMVLTTTGAKSGLPRTIPLVYTRDGDRLVIIASKGGAPTNPDWYHNLVANPTATVELPGKTFQVTAAIASSASRRRRCPVSPTISATRPGASPSSYWSASPESRWHTTSHRREAR